MRAPGCAADTDGTADVHRKTHDGAEAAEQEAVTAEAAGGKGAAAAAREGAARRSAGQAATTQARILVEGERHGSGSQTVSTAYKSRHSAAGSRRQPQCRGAPRGAGDLRVDFAPAGRREQCQRRSAHTPTN